MQDIAKDQSLAKLEALGGPVFSTVWLLFLIQPIYDMGSSPEVGVSKLGIVLLVFLFVINYLSLMLVNTFRGASVNVVPTRSIIGRLILLALMATGISIVGGYGYAGLFIDTSAALGAKLRNRHAALPVATLTLIPLVIGVIQGIPWLDVVKTTLMTGAIGFLVIGIVRLLFTIRLLQQAREEITRLAIANERLRFARDLHDLLGHSLSLISVKSELAQRLISSSPQRATVEMKDIELVARDALGEVREAVESYRQSSLANELGRAHKTLDAAGIEFRMEQTTVALPTRIETAFVWVIREAVTNVVRHSKAHRCLIAITVAKDVAQCEILNDDHGFGASTVGSPVFGNGLSGMQERVQACGGSVSVERKSDGGFRLVVSIPIDSKDSFSKSEGGHST